jgi:Dolichyl-phosphate-mannose-protein mannosyltransferase
MPKRTLILIGFILVKFLLQYAIVSPEYELHRDEFLHLDQANHLAWGYLSVPPFTSWLSCIILFFGDSIFWVRFFPALFGALTILVVWKAIEALNGNLFALMLGATCVLFSVLLRLNILYQPNSFDVLGWTTFYYILIRYISTQHTKWLFAAALVFAVSFLNKYNVGFLLIGLLPALLVTEHRNIFGKKQFYVAFLLALLLMLPNVIWQYNNHFPVITHLKELAATQLINVKRWDFLKNQLLFFSAALPVIIAALYALLFYPPFKKYRVFCWSIVFTLLIFIYLKAKSYYAIGLYPVYIAFGSVFISAILNTGFKKYLRYVILALPLVFFIFTFRLMFPVNSPAYISEHAAPFKALGLLRWEDGKDHILPQDFADMLGWKELAQKVDSIYATLPDTAQTMVLCDNYGQAGAINYYAKNKKIKAVSFSADYINWFRLDKKTDNLVRVKSAEGKEEELKETGPFFDTSVTADSVTNIFAREYGTAIFVFKKANIDVNKRIAKEIAAIKSEW